MFNLSIAELRALAQFKQELQASEIAHAWEDFVIMMSLPVKVTS